MVTLETSQSQVNFSGFSINIHKISKSNLTDIIDGVQKNTDLISYFFEGKLHIFFIIDTSRDDFDLRFKNISKFLNKDSEFCNLIQPMSSMTLRNYLNNPIGINSNTKTLEKNSVIQFSIKSINKQKLKDLINVDFEKFLVRFIFTTSNFKNESGTFLSFLIIALQNKVSKHDETAFLHKIAQIDNNIEITKVPKKFIKKNPIRFKLGFTENSITSLNHDNVIDAFTPEKLVKAIPKDHVKINSILETKNLQKPTLPRIETNIFEQQIKEQIEDLLQKYGWKIYSREKNQSSFSSDSIPIELRLVWSLNSYNLIDELETCQFDFNMCLDKSNNIIEV